VKPIIVSDKFCALKKTSPSDAKINTIRIFIKLLVIKIVASNLLGFCKSNTTGFCSLLSSEIFIISVFDREKKATSVPDIKAEQKSNTIKKIIAVKDMRSN
jgi:hypothetical protein